MPQQYDYFVGLMAELLKAKIAILQLGDEADTDKIIFEEIRKKAPFLPVIGLAQGP